MITGVHAVIFTTDAERDRAFFRDVLELPSVDAGGGWLIFALPPAELAAHPADEGGRHELYLMCDDVHATVADLKTKGVDGKRPISDEGFGLMTAAGPALYLLGHALFPLRMAGSITWKRLAGALACLFAGLVGFVLPALAVVALLVGILAAVIGAEQLAAARRRVRGEPSPLERLEASARTK
jgi:hypothetical protein